MGGVRPLGGGMTLLSGGVGPGGGGGVNKLS